MSRKLDKESVFVDKGSECFNESPQSKARFHILKTHLWLTGATKRAVTATRKPVLMPVPLLVKTPPVLVVLWGTVALRAEFVLWRWWRITKRYETLIARVGIVKIHKTWRGLSRIRKSPVHLAEELVVSSNCLATKL